MTPGEPYPLARLVGPEWRWLTDAPRGIVVLLRRDGAWTEFDQDVARDCPPGAARVIAERMRHATPGRFVVITSYTLERDVRRYDAKIQAVQ